MEEMVPCRTKAGGQRGGHPAGHSLQQTQQSFLCLSCGNHKDLTNIYHSKIENKKTIMLFFTGIQ